MAKRRVKLLAARPIDDELLMSGSVVDLPERQAKQLESQGRAVWAPGAELSERAARARHRRLNDRATRPATEPGSADNSKEPSGPELPLDVNAATAEDLAQVEYLNEALAKAIVEHRDKNGPFTSIVPVGDDKGLTVIKNIGKTTAEKLADGVLEAKQPEPPALLNVNEATAEQLQEIGSIGKEIAEAIVNHVKGSGPFKSITKTDDDEGLVAIPGIAEETAQELSEYLTV